MILRASMVTRPGGPSRPSFSTTSPPQFLYRQGFGFRGWLPQMPLQIGAKFGYLDAFAFEELALEGGIRFANQEFAAVANHAMPGDGFSRGRCRHCPTRGSRPAANLRRLG